MKKILIIGLFSLVAFTFLVSSVDSLECGTNGFSFEGNCWYQGERGESCDTVCEGVGKTCLGMVDRNWNGNSSCTVCKHFLGEEKVCYKDGKFAGQNSYDPSYDSKWGHCIIRSLYVDQQCDAEHSYAKRQCVCKGDENETIQQSNNVVVPEPNNTQSTPPVENNVNTPPANNEKTTSENIDAVQNGGDIGKNTGKEGKNKVLIFFVILIPLLLISFILIYFLRKRSLKNIQTNTNINSGVQ